MQLERKHLRDKIERFIESKIITGQSQPVGLGWSLWEDFSLSREDFLVFLNDDTIGVYLLKRTGQHYAFRAIVLNSVGIYPELADLVFKSKSNGLLHRYKGALIISGTYIGELTPDRFDKDDIDSLITVIELSDCETAKAFLIHDSERIRLEAYNKIGILNCADLMIKDKSPAIRVTACEHLPHNDPMFEIIMSDRSKWVFAIVLKKIDKKHIPMMLGSKHLKHKFIKIILDKRLSGLENL